MLFRSTKIEIDDMIEIESIGEKKIETETGIDITKIGVTEGIEIELGMIILGHMTRKKMVGMEETLTLVIGGMRTSRNSIRCIRVEFRE